MEYYFIIIILLLEIIALMKSANYFVYQVKWLINMKKNLCNYLYINSITEKNNLIQLNNQNEKNKEKQFREFRIPNVINIPIKTPCDRTKLKNLIINPICDKLFNGYSINILNYGQRGTGKTSFFLTPPNGLLFIISNNLLRYKIINKNYGIKLGMSIYELRHSCFNDLLSNKRVINNQFEIIEFNEYNNIIIRINTVYEIVSIMNMNYTNYNKEENKYLPNQSHIFIKIYILNSNEDVYSCLNMIDLVGTESTSNINNKDTKFIDSSEKQLLRKELMSINKLITEISLLTYSSSV